MRARRSSSRPCCVSTTCRPICRAGRDLRRGGAGLSPQGRRLLSNGYAIVGYGNYRTGARGWRARERRLLRRARRRQPELRDWPMATRSTAAWTTATATMTTPTAATTPTCAGTLPSAAPSAKAISPVACAAASATAATATTATTSASTATTACAWTPDNQLAVGAECRASATTRHGPLRRSHAQHRRADRQLDGLAARRQGQLHARRAAPGASSQPRPQPTATPNFFGLSPSVSFTLTENAGRLRLRLVAARPLQRRAPERRRPTTVWASAPATTTSTKSAAG